MDPKGVGFGSASDGGPEPEGFARGQVVVGVGAADAMTAGEERGDDMARYFAFATGGLENGLLEGSATLGNEGLGNDIDRPTLGGESPKEPG